MKTCGNCTHWDSKTEWCTVMPRWVELLIWDMDFDGEEDLPYMPPNALADECACFQENAAEGPG